MFGRKPERGKVNSKLKRAKRGRNLGGEATDLKVNQKYALSLHRFIVNQFSGITGIAHKNKK
jgi:hypothetical protein